MLVTQIIKNVETIFQQIKELNGVYRNIASQIGISENEFLIWYILLAFDEEYSQQDICNTWFLAKQTVNNIIKNMVQENYVVLEVVPKTRNRKIIRLTEKGREYGASFIQPICDAEERTLNRLNQKELEACNKALANYINVLKEEIDNH